MAMTAMEATMSMGKGMRLEDEIAMLDSKMDGALTALPEVPGYGLLTGKVPANRSAARSADANGLDQMSSQEREQLLLEHLPTVRFIARRIHERLPQHVELDDLISAGMIGLIDAFSNSITARKCSSKAMRSFVFAAPSWIRSAPSTGVRANCGARDGLSKRQSAR